MFSFEFKPTSHEEFMEAFRELNRTMADAGLSAGRYEFTASAHEMSFRAWGTVNARPGDYADLWRETLLSAVHEASGARNELVKARSHILEDMRQRESRAHQHRLRMTALERIALIQPPGIPEPGNEVVP